MRELFYFLNRDPDSGITVAGVLRARAHVGVIVPICFLFLLLVGLLTCFHLMLIFKNQTTHEFLKNTY